MFKKYASYFVSYLLFALSKKEIDKISKIILFGSTAKDEAEKESDIDIFIEINKKSKTFENKIDKITEEFYKSREALIFKSKKIDNKINILLGELKDWPDLENSIESTGIMLYGKYSSKTIKRNGKKYSLIFWKKIEKNRGALLNKIYGFKVRDKRYSGLLEKFKGKKLGKSSALIPAEHTNEFLNILKPYKVDAKVIEIWT